MPPQASTCLYAQFEVSAPFAGFAALLLPAAALEAFAQMILNAAMGQASGPGTCGMCDRVFPQAALSLAGAHLHTSLAMPAHAARRRCQYPVAGVPQQG
jgi:hypothetical protein